MLKRHFVEYTPINRLKNVLVCIGVQAKYYTDTTSTSTSDAVESFLVLLSSPSGRVALADEVSRLVMSCGSGLELSSRESCHIVPNCRD